MSLHNDNVHSHNALSVKLFWLKQIQVLKQPSYSPYSILCNLLIFPKLYISLKLSHFEFRAMWQQYQKYFQKIISSSYLFTGGPNKNLRKTLSQDGQSPRYKGMLTTELWHIMYPWCLHSIIYIIWLALQQQICICNNNVINEHHKEYITKICVLQTGVYISASDSMLLIHSFTKFGQLMPRTCKSKN